MRALSRWILHFQAVRRNRHAGRVSRQGVHGLRALPRGILQGRCSAGGLPGTMSAVRRVPRRELHIRAVPWYGLLCHRADLHSLQHVRAEELLRIRVHWEGDQRRAHVRRMHELVSRWHVRGFRLPGDQQQAVTRQVRHMRAVQCGAVHLHPMQRA